VEKFWKSVKIWQNCSHVIRVQFLVRPVWWLRPLRIRSVSKLHRPVLIAGMHVLTALSLSPEPQCSRQAAFFYTRRKDPYSVVSDPIPWLWTTTGSVFLEVVSSLMEACVQRETRRLRDYYYCIIQGGSKQNTPPENMQYLRNLWSDFKNSWSCLILTLLLI